MSFFICNSSTSFSIADFTLGDENTLWTLFKNDCAFGGDHLGPDACHLGTAEGAGGGPPDCP